MAIWIKRSGDLLRLRSLPFTRLTLTLCLAVAFFIPAFLDWEGGNYRHPGTRFWHVALILVAGLTASPWRSLIIDGAREQITWRKRALFMCKTASAPLDDAASATFVDRLRLGPLACCALRLHFASQTYTFPLGWCWRGRLDLERREAMLAIRERLPVSDETAARVLDTAPPPKRRLQISLRRALIATALVGGVLATSKAIEWQTGESQLPVTVVAACVVAVAAICYRPGSAVTARLVPSLVAIYAPFAWIVLEVYPLGRISGLLEGALWFPAIWTVFFPVMRPHHNTPALLAAVVLLELALALSCAWRGRKAALICTIFLALLSTLGSFILNAGIRA